MPRVDGVIEAVRYKSGRIELVRAYERRGATFSDHVLLDRTTLVERLQQGKHFFVGSRREFQASTFELGDAVSLVGPDGHQYIMTGPGADHDRLDGSPIF